MDLHNNVQRKKEKLHNDDKANEKKEDVNNSIVKFIALKCFLSEIVHFIIKFN
jgi:hypothetical protein